MVDINKIRQIEPRSLENLESASNKKTPQKATNDSLFNSDDTQTKERSYGNFSTISKEEAKEYAIELHDAMDSLFADKNAVKEILVDGKLDSYDIVQIMIEYQYANKSYLSDDIAKKFFGNTEKELMTVLAKACFEVAHDDNHLVSSQAMHRFDLEQSLRKFASKKDDSNVVSATILTGISDSAAPVMNGTGCYG